MYNKRNIKYILTHPKESHDVCISQKNLLHWFLVGWTINIPDTKIMVPYIGLQMSEFKIEYSIEL